MRLDLSHTMEKAVISSITLSDFSGIKSISDLCFGKNYLSINSLNKISSHEGVFSKIEVNGVLVGFCIATTIDSLIDNKWFSLKEYKNISEFPFSVIKTIAITPNYQSKGLGSKLLESTVLKLEAKFELENLFFPAWIINEKSRLKTKLLKMGFHYIKQINQYWFNESIELGYNCPACGNPPCTCSIGLYKKVV